MFGWVGVAVEITAHAIVSLASCRWEMEGKGGWVREQADVNVFWVVEVQPVQSIFMVSSRILFCFLNFQQLYRS